MAGWRAYNPHTGEVESGMYDRPFIIRGTPRGWSVWDLPPCPPTHSRESDTTITAFATLAEAEEWLRRHEADYLKGPSGFASLHIENWNE